MTKAVENAVRECDMGLNPSSEGQGQVHVPIPKSTKESREAVAKVAAKHAEKVRSLEIDRDASSIDGGCRNPLTTRGWNR